MRYQPQYGFWIIINAKQLSGWHIQMATLVTHQWKIYHSFLQNRWCLLKAILHQPDDLMHVYRQLYETSPTDLMNITETFYHTNLTNFISWPTPLEALSHQPCILDVHNWKHVTPVLQMWWCTLLTALSHQPYRVDDVMHTAKSLSHRSYRCDDMVHNTDSFITPTLQTGWHDVHHWKH